jgi:sucrose phosphorylase
MSDAILSRIKSRLDFIYGAEQAERVFPDLLKVLDRYKGAIKPALGTWSEKDTFLITYADTLKGSQPPLQVLDQFLEKQVGDAFTMVHLLPHFPFTSDDGFSVVDYRQVRPDLGDWQDIEKISSRYRVCFDFVVNHVSASSQYVKGYCAGDPRFADFFIALDPKTDTSQVFRPRNVPLLTEFETAGGKKWLWTTFSADQVDWNYANPRVLLEMVDILLYYAQRGSTIIRIDAPTYIWKELGTNCIHRPKGHELMKLFRDVYDAVAPHMIILSETNVPHKENISYFGNGRDEAQMVYNFPLQSLVLWTVTQEDSGPISAWAKTVEQAGERCTFLNFTASHDGAALLGSKGFLSDEDRDAMCRRAKAHGGDVGMRAHGDGTTSPYELNINYFDYINDPNGTELLQTQVQRFVLSQAIACSLMGIPAIYIHSLLGSGNDYEGVKRTGRARSINREQLDAAAVEAEISRPGTRRNLVFNGIKRLLEVRQSQPAFHPNNPQEILDLGKSLLGIRRIEKNGPGLIAVLNISGKPQKLSRRTIATAAALKDVWSQETLTDAEIALAPYQFRWLVPTAAVN